MSDNPMDDPLARRELAERIMRDPRALHVPPGHPYSPLPSPQDVDRALARAGAATAALPGIDLREAAQLELLECLLALGADLPFAAAPGGSRYRFDNTWFPHFDALVYALLLRHLRPGRVIEVGAGHSSALALDIDERFLGGTTRFTFVEPDAGRLRSLVPAEELDGRLMELPVQDVPVALFHELGAGDVLFIDGSHVLKAGSDVQHLIDEVFPRLSPNVFVHVHDIFYPFEYPASWLRSGCALNEAYAVRALLQSPSAFEIVLFDSFIARFHHDWIARHIPRALEETFPSSGLWLRRR